MHPLLAHFIISLLHHGHVGVDTLLETGKTDFLGVRLVAAEEAHWVCHRIISVFCAILRIAHILDSLPKRSEVAKMLLLHIGIFVDGTILRELL